MNTHPTPKAHYSLLTTITISFVAWLFISLVLTLCNIFYTPLLWLVFVSLALGTGYWIFKHKLLKTLSRETLGVTIFSCVIAISIAHFTIPTIFSGRDQGSYSNAAIHLTQHHQLAFATPASDAFFKLHEPGKALNFPGFDYTSDGKLITQFPLGYIVWLASFFALFGLSGLVIANIITTVLFLTSLYALLRVFVSRFYAYFGLVIAATSLSMVWFSKITLSENLALTLFTLLALYLVRTFQEKSATVPLIALALASFFAFTRIEGLLFFLITLGILSFAPAMRSVWKSKSLVYVITPAIIFALLFLRNLFLNLPFYKAIAKAGLRKWQALFETCANDCASGEAISLWHTLYTYGFFPVLIIGSVSILLFIKRRHVLALIPFLLALPTFFYLFSPSISLDHPWMLRRFIFSVYPSLLFSAIVGIAIIQTFLTQKYPGHFLFKRHFYASILLSTLLLSQLSFTLQYSGFSENKALLEQTSALAEHFTNHDLVLVDRLATGDGFAMIPEALNFLGNTNAVYFFNPQDLAMLDVSYFDNTYIIVSQDEISRYIKAFAPRLTPIATSEFTTERLLATDDSTLPTRTQTTTPFVVLQFK